MNQNFLHKATQKVLELQKENGSWEGSIVYNSYPTALRLILNKILNVSDDKWEQKAIKLLESTQHKDGSWKILDHNFEHHPFLKEAELDLNIEVKASCIRNTVLATLALDLYGADKSMVDKSESFIKANKSLEKLIDPFTYILLAYFDEKLWERVKVPPIEILLLPRRFKLSVDRFVPAWIRDASIGALLFKTLCTKKWKQNPLKRIAVKKGIQMLKESQLQDGSWFGTLQPTIYPVLSLFVYDKLGNYEYIKKSLSFIRRKTDCESGYVHRFHLPVWDTAHSVLSLLQLEKKELKPFIDKGCSYLLSAQNPKNGRWGFAPEITLYPDCDDTSMSIRSLLLSGYSKKILEKPIQWLLDMQNTDGGWAAFYKNHAKKKPGALLTSEKDSLTILQDPSVSDITANVIKTLSIYGIDKDSRVIKKALDFLFKDQLNNGAWYGRWGLCYLYGTTRVLDALQTVGYNMEDKKIARAIEWLINCQNTDGGWGEHFISYFREDMGGIGYSKPCQTGWVLHTLIPILGVKNERVLRGIKYLINTQKEDGGWDSKVSVGALEVYENSIYALTFPLLGLATYEKYSKLT